MACREITVQNGKLFFAWPSVQRVSCTLGQTESFVNPTTDLERRIKYSLTACSLEKERRSLDLFYNKILYWSNGIGRARLLPCHGSTLYLVKQFRDSVPPNWKIFLFRNFQFIDMEKFLFFFLIFIHDKCTDGWTWKIPIPLLVRSLFRSTTIFDPPSAKATFYSFSFRLNGQMRIYLVKQ